MKVKSIFIDKLGGIRIEDKEYSERQDRLNFFIRQGKTRLGAEDFPEQILPIEETRTFELIQYAVSKNEPIKYRIYEEI